MCSTVARPFYTLLNVPISLIMAPLRMFGCSILNTFMMYVCMQFLVQMGIACGHSDDGVWMVHNLGVWLMDATNAMSSPSRHNKTLEFGIFWALNIAKATMLSFCFFHISEKVALHTILIVSKNIAKKMKNQPIHFTSSKYFFGKIKYFFHVAMEWFHNRIGVLPYMWNVVIANTPHSHLMQPMVLKACNESRCIGIISYHDIYL
jgi:hypothetical protein